MTVLSHGIDSITVQMPYQITSNALDDKPYQHEIAGDFQQFWIHVVWVVTILWR